MNLKKVSRALISVSDKSELTKILKVLKKFKVEILSSGGTYKKINRLGYKSIEISDFTNSPEILDGRVKTLHPKLYGGILFKRNNKKHQKQIKKINIKKIDLVIVNFYPFEETVKTGNDKKIIEPDIFPYINKVESLLRSEMEESRFFSLSTFLRSVKRIRGDDAEAIYSQEMIERIIKEQSKQDLKLVSNDRKMTRVTGLIENKTSSEMKKIYNKLDSLSNSFPPYLSIECTGTTVVALRTGLVFCILFFPIASLCFINASMGTDCTCPSI